MTTGRGPDPIPPSRPLPPGEEVVVLTGTWVLPGTVAAEDALPRRVDAASTFPTGSSPPLSAVDTAVPGFLTTLAGAAHPHMRQSEGDGAADRDRLTPPGAGRLRWARGLPPWPGGQNAYSRAE